MIDSSVTYLIKCLISKYLKLTGGSSHLLGVEIRLEKIIFSFFYCIKPEKYAERNNF